MTAHSRISWHRSIRRSSTGWPKSPSRSGLRLQPGQDLLLTAPVAALPLARRIAEHAYKAGAGLVTPIFSDEEMTLSRYRYRAGCQLRPRAGLAL